VTFITLTALVKVQCKENEQEFTSHPLSGRVDSRGISQTEADTMPYRSLSEKLLSLRSVSQALDATGALDENAAARAALKSILENRIQIRGSGVR
jgi:hypothetical protein